MTRGNSRAWVGAAAGRGAALWCRAVAFGALAALAAFAPENALAQTPGANCADPLVVSIPAELPYFSAMSVCGLGNDSACLGTAEDAVYKLVVTEPVCVRMVVTPQTAARFYLGSTCPPCGAVWFTELDGAALPPGEHFVVVKPAVCDIGLYIEACQVRACCLQTGGCAMLGAAECTAVNGLDRGVGTSCGNTFCVEAVTCCLADGSCQSIVPTACQAAGGQPLFDVDCSAGLCGPKSCCLPNRSCVDETVVRDCLGLGGTPLNDGGTCATTTCDLICRRGDVNCDGRVDNFDIDPFVLVVVWGSNPQIPSTWTFGEDCWAIRSCTCDANWSGSLNGFDVDPFVACMVTLPPVLHECPAP
ncbi:MAG: hypothetical protein IPM64_02060 [Phycisphaerales bacterium]|nr:hypothetical protein [Phycisphaerales bacterium]